MTCGTRDPSSRREWGPEVGRVRLFAVVNNTHYTSQRFRHFLFLTEKKQRRETAGRVRAGLGPTPASLAAGCASNHYAVCKRICPTFSPSIATSSLLAMVTQSPKETCSCGMKPP